MNAIVPENRYFRRRSSEQNWSCRPGNGVKDAHRILEKAAKFGVGVPRDLLGA